MASWKYLLLCWLGLLLLSLLTVELGAAGATPLLAGGVLLVALGKAWLIIDGFMEMRHANWFWRSLMLGWPLSLGLTIWLSIALR
jgi:hypothetical protein